MKKKQKQKQFADLTNLLHSLHVTPILDAIGIKEIAAETNNDPTLKDQKRYNSMWKTLYPPNDKPYLTS